MLKRLLLLLMVPLVGMAFASEGEKPVARDYTRVHADQRHHQKEEQALQHVNKPEQR